MLKRTLLLLSFFSFGVFLQAAQTPAKPARTDKKAILDRIATGQQEDMKTNLRFLNQFFPKLLSNAPLVGKYDDWDAFKKAEGARADEVLSQTKSDIARVEIWLSQINDYYKQEYDDAVKAREKVLYAMNKNFRSQKPDYPKFFKNKQIIFIWEEGGHAVPEIMDSTLEVLQEIKKANPNKRILFSPEQLIWFDMEPFANSALIAGKTDLRAPQIRFAGEEMHPNLKSATRYENLWDKVSALGLDTLSMDDVLVDWSFMYSFFKVGNISIPYLGGEEAFDNAYYRFRSNYYGVHQRNTQWNYRIRLVEPYYDIIVVFAGGAHYGLKKLLDKPADKVLDVFIYKLAVDDEVKNWDRKAREGQGTYNDAQFRADKKEKEEIAKTLTSTVYNQLQENGHISALYIVIP